MKLAFELDAERAAQRDAVAALAARLGAAQAGFSREAWRELGESGALAAGSEPGSGLADRAAVCEALGAAAFPGPIVETFLAIDLLGGTAAEALAAGERISAVGAPPLFPFAAQADAEAWIALEGERAFRAAPRGPVEPLASLAGDAWGRAEIVRGAELAAAPRALARARVAAAALLGAAGERAIAIAAEHARARKQFGRALGEYQAVAHPLASAWVGVASAQQLARIAADAADAGASEARELAAAAWLAARGAALRAGEVAHQALGAAGIVREGPLFRITARIRQWASLPLGVAEVRAALAVASAPAAQAPR
jgi:hypothetical protein